MFIGIYHRANSITYMGIASGVAGLYLSVTGRLDYAMICLIISGVCDLFDGVFARRFARTEWEKQFGVQIDSLADALCFAAFPVVLLFCAGLTQWYHILILIFYAFAAVTRLAFFNVSLISTDTSVPVSHFRGLPVTYAAFFFPVFWLSSFVAGEAAGHIVMSGVALVLAVLFVLDIKIPKPRGLAYLFFVLMAVGTIVLIALR